MSDETYWERMYEEEKKENNNLDEIICILMDMIGSVSKEKIPFWAKKSFITYMYKYNVVDSFWPTILDFVESMTVHGFRELNKEAVIEAVRCAQEENMLIEYKDAIDKVKYMYYEGGIGE